MRALSGATLSEIVKPITRPINLIEIVFAAVTYRLSTGPTVTWNAQTWIASGAKVENLQSLVGGAMDGRISLPNTDNAASALVLVDGVADRVCRIYQLYGDGPYSVGDEIKLFEGVCDNAEIDLDRVVINITTERRLSETAPRIYFEAFCTRLPPAGTVISWGGEHYRLEARDG